MAAPDPFPVRRAARYVHHSWVLPSVPWAFVEPHGRRAWLNHGRSLGDLALLGGLTPCDLLALVEDRAPDPHDPEDCVLSLCRALREWRAANP